MALRFAILMTPRANVTVTTIGSPSGMAATAKLKQEPVINTTNVKGISTLRHQEPMTNCSDS
jgi:hypothetical protein